MPIKRLKSQKAISVMSRILLWKLQEDCKQQAPWCRTSPVWGSGDDGQANIHVFFHLKLKEVTLDGQPCKMENGKVIVAEITCLCSGCVWEEKNSRQANIQIFLHPKLMTQSPWRELAECVPGLPPGAARWVVNHLPPLLLPPPCRADHPQDIHALYQRGKTAQHH